MTLAKDSLAGVLFFLFGLGTALVGWRYGFGAGSRVGPGYFPVVVGGVMAILGGVLFMRSLRIEDVAQQISRWELRPLFVLVVAVVVFAVVIDRVGLVPAVFALVLISAYARRGARFFETVILAAALTAMIVGIFIYGLNMPLKLGV